MRRAAWWAEITTIPAESLVFVDETGGSIRFTRTYAEARRVQRVLGQAPRNHGKSTSLVAALSAKGIFVPVRQLGAFQGASFTANAQEVLCLQLRPGQVVSEVVFTVGQFVSHATPIVLVARQQQPSIFPNILRWRLGRDPDEG